MKKLLACLLMTLLLIPAARAEGKSYEGRVVSTETAAVLAPAAGTIATVSCQAGPPIQAGTEVAALRTTTVYAEQAGTVTVFGAPGDPIESLTSRYGAVVYIEPDYNLTLTGSTAYAYDAAENKNIHPGEIVYLKSVSTSIGHTGTGIVTVVNGTKYTVEVISGNVTDEDVVYIYRSASHDLKTRIGRGTVSYTGAAAMTGTGVISQMLVHDGDHVEPGMPLYTTLEASPYDWQMISPADGVVASVSVTPGTAVEAGALIAEICPDSARRLEIIVEARDLRTITAGCPVEISFDNGAEAAGVVERVSSMAYVPETVEEGDDAVYFAVYVSFPAETSVPYGMTAKAVVSQ